MCGCACELGGGSGGFRDDYDGVSEGGGEEDEGGELGSDSVLIIYYFVWEMSWRGEGGDGDI